MQYDVNIFIFSVTWKGTGTGQVPRHVLKQLVTVMW